MDRAEAPDTALEGMDVERVVRNDGRLLLLFTWGEATRESPAAEPAPWDGPA